MFFDPNERFLVLYSTKQINIIPIREGITGKDVFNYKINKKIFSKICDVQFVSEDAENYRCDIACKMNDH